MVKRNKLTFNKIKKDIRQVDTTPKSDHTVRMKTEVLAAYARTIAEQEKKLKELTQLRMEEREKHLREMFDIRRSFSAEVPPVPVAEITDEEFAKFEKEFHKKASKPKKKRSDVFDRLYKGGSSVGKGGKGNKGGKKKKAAMRVPKKKATKKE